jgi:hypothetical protein
MEIGIRSTIQQHIQGLFMDDYSKICAGDSLAELQTEVQQSVDDLWN